MKNNLGPTIKEIRRQAHISQADLSERVGVTPSAICQIENRGTVNPKIDLLTRILYELKCPVGYAFKKADFPVYGDNPGLCEPPMLEVCEIIKRIPGAEKRHRLEFLLLETARAWRDYDD